ncbi:hypothetical protein AHAS_Ahas18G0143100 [Arachis hypogaea]
MVSRKRKQILEVSTLESESESDDETQSKKRKHIVENLSSEEQTESYDVTDVRTEEIEEFFRESKKKKTNEKVAQGTPQPQQPAESTPTLPLAPSKINPPPEATAALIMIANTASYVLKQFPVPSFSPGFTYSSQEEMLTQEG